MQPHHAGHLLFPELSGGQVAAGVDAAELPQPVQRLQPLQGRPGVHDATGGVKRPDDVPRPSCRRRRPRRRLRAVFELQAAGVEMPLRRPPLQPLARQLLTLVGAGRRRGLDL